MKKQYILKLIGYKQGNNLRMHKQIGVYHNLHKAKIAAKRDRKARTNRSGVRWHRYRNQEMRADYVAHKGATFSYEISVVGNNRW